MRHMQSAMPLAGIFRSLNSVSQDNYNDQPDVTVTAHPCMYAEFPA